MGLKRGWSARWRFSGVFLPALEWELSVEEQSLRKFEEHTQAGTFFRNVRRLPDVADQRKALAQAIKTINKVEQSSVRDDILSALSGDEAAQRRVLAAGAWRALNRRTPKEPVSDFGRIAALVACRWERGRGDPGTDS